MRMHPGSNDETLLRDLERAVLRLADAVDGEPPIAAALRRFARALPELPRVPPRPVPSAGEREVRDLLYQALDAGALDVRGFDWLMLAEGRARRAAGRHTAASPIAHDGPSS